LRGQLIDVRSGDLRERTESMSEVVSRMGQPTGRVGQPIKQVLACNTLCGDWDDRCRGEGQDR
jgi:hypothetical protein